MSVFQTSNRRLYSVRDRSVVSLTLLSIAGAVFALLLAAVVIAATAIRAPAGAPAPEAALFGP